MLKTEYQAIIKQLREITDRLDGLDHDLTKDRQDLSDFNVRLENVSTELGEVKKAINMNAERVQNKVHGEVQQISDATDNLTAQIAESKMVVLQEKSKGFWKWLFRRN